MMNIKKIAGFLLLLSLSITVTFAQTEQTETKDVSKEELKQFATAFQEVQVVNQQAQQNMITVVEEEGLNVQRYQEIQKAHQDPNQDVEATSEELEQFETVSQELEKIQVEAQQQMQEKIVEEGLSVNRYQELATTIQNDPELQQKLQKYLQN
ncbi:MAG: DUF4168 domain-containing protein [Bacteroidota bacterium]